MLCTFNASPETTCESDDVVARLSGGELCASHLHELYPDEVESGHADSIPDITFLY
jgi:hypothetical protein